MIQRLLLIAGLLIGLTAGVEAQTQRQSIFDYAPKAAVTKDFNNLLDEIGIK